jgi:SPP1 family predicted phage head-tail adaptor
MHSGSLRHRISIQAKTETRDARGGIIETWATVATRWGSIEPLSARELMQAQQVDAQVSHRVILRHYETLTHEHRLEKAGRIFHISAVTNPLERGKETVILAMEQAA